MQYCNWAVLTRQVMQYCDRPVCVNLAPEVKAVSPVQGQSRPGNEEALDVADSTLIPDSQPQERQPGGLQNPLQQLQPLQFSDEQRPFFSQQPSVMLPTGLVYQVLCSLPGYSFVRKCCTSSDATTWMQSMLETCQDDPRYTACTCTI